MILTTTTSDFAEQHPELGFTDEQVEAEVAKLSPDDKKLYEEYHEFLRHILLPAWRDYRNAGLKLN